MQPKNLPSQLPFLPGNVYQDPTITRYHKTQMLGVRDGSMLGKLHLISNVSRKDHQLARKR